MQRDAFLKTRGATKCPLGVAAGATSVYATSVRRRSASGTNAPQQMALRMSGHFADEGGNPTTAPQKIKQRIY